jgi:DNA-binding NarL/FixJ family response regulator
MRVILVGTHAQRGHLRERLAGSNLVVVGEATSRADVRLRQATADALLVAVHDDPDGLEIYREELTPRELEVLGLLAEGLPNKAIAQRLGISDQTVKFHVAALSGKLGASNRTDAVRLAITRGLVVL